MVWGKNDDTVICGGLGQYVTQYSFTGQEIMHWKVANIVDMDYNEKEETLVACCQQQKVNIIFFKTNIIETFVVLVC